MGWRMKRYGWLVVVWMGCQRLEVDDGPGPSASGGESSGSSSGGSDDSGSTAATTSAPDPDLAIPEPKTHASCGGVECACDEVCVVSDEYCREGGWYEPPAHCLALPAACAALEGAQAQGCLTDRVCEGGLWVEQWVPERGVLTCQNPGQVCGDTD